MKKKILASLLMSTVVLTIGGQMVSATELNAAKTTGDVGFTFGDKPETVKPEEGPKDEDDTVIEEDKDKDGKPKPLPNNGGIYVTHLPSISFGNSNKTSLKTTDYPAYTEKRTLVDSPEGESKDFYMPHSVQVSDLSGNEKSTWKLSVSQDSAFKSEDGISELVNSRINIYETTFTNSLRDKQTLADNINGISITESTKFNSIPVGSEEGQLTVLESKKPGFTNASTTSAVFSKDYVASNFSPKLTGETAAYAGVKLNVPASDNSKAKVYRTELTWTLTVEPGNTEGSGEE
ncbi:WxL domain-containing protein [Enterococcus rotai]|uniref:WxL domain-containing protein n=1 Tax=Enterococcus rotai TaxID=118060 RepID=UPI0032B5B907